MNEDKKNTKKTYEIPHGVGDEIGILQARVLSGDMRAFKLLLSKAVGTAKEAGMLDLYKQYEVLWKDFLKNEEWIDFFKENGELKWSYHTMFLPPPEDELYKEICSILKYVPRGESLSQVEYKRVTGKLLNRREEMMPILHNFITSVFKDYPSYKEGLWSYMARLSEAEKSQIRTEEEVET